MVITILTQFKQISFYTTVKSYFSNFTMNKSISISDLFKTNIEVEGRSGSFSEFILSFFLLIILTYTVQKLYEKKGRTVGDKKYFGSFFMIWSISIFLIISVIKSSVVLSLGMVGALSIVRFRNAIKDTEQIMYLLMLIGLSMALASNQYLYTLVVFGFITLYIYFRDLKTQSQVHSQFLYVRFENKEILNDVIEFVCDKNNQIVSINHSGNTFEIVSTCNNFNEAEIANNSNWMIEKGITFRINQNYYQ